VRTLDRYLIRQILPPFVVALVVFTFILAVPPMLERAQALLAKGVPLQTVGVLLLNLLPQALGVTIPMAFLGGLLMALSRLSADREGVALLACGVSPSRLLVPVLTLGFLVGAADLYVMVQAVPDSNQAFREVTYKLLAKKTESDVKAGLFYQGFPGKVLYVQASRPGGGWSGVFLADTSQPGRTTVTLAEQGLAVMDEARRQVHFLLYHARTYAPGVDPLVYNVTRTEGDEPVRLTITADEVFGSGVLERGLPEKTIGDLRAMIAAQRQAGVSPHQAILYLHQKFSFPVACLVFAICGVAVGLHTRREGKLGGLMLGLAIVFLYYALMEIAESLTKGHLLNAVWARWVPNLVMGGIGLVALFWRSRAAGADVSVPMPAWLDRLMNGAPPPLPAAAAPGDPPAPRKVVLVIRVPRLSLPMPRILDLYVTGHYLRMFALSVAALLLLYYIGTVIDLSDKVLKGQATASMLLQFLWYSTPQYLVYLVPMATLLAVLGTIGGLTRSSEMTVMRACGVSLYRAALPLMAFALVWSGLLFLLQEHLLAPANRRAQILNETIRTGVPPHTLNIENRNWLVSRTGQVYHYQLYAGAPASPTLIGLSVYDTALSPYRLLTHTYTPRAVYTGGTWRVDEGWKQTFSAQDRPVGEAFATRALALGATPVEFGAAKLDADLMTFGQLRGYIARLGKSGFSVAEERVRLQSKIAFPLVTLVMTILAVPFGVTTGRHGALYGVGLAVGLATLHFLLAYFFMAVGSAAVMPAPLAAWATNILFLAAAGYGLLTVRT
jgi:LPS export ABC transporter permease LptG/LPS export ABC transporter permease LptF